MSLVSFFFTISGQILSSWAELFSVPKNSNKIGQKKYSNFKGIPPKWWFKIRESSLKIAPKTIQVWRTLSIIICPAHPPQKTKLVGGFSHIFGIFTPKLGEENHPFWRSHFSNEWFNNMFDIFASFENTTRYSNWTTHLKNTTQGDSRNPDHRAPNHQSTGKNLLNG